MKRPSDSNQGPSPSKVTKLEPLPTNPGVYDRLPFPNFAKPQEVGGFSTGKAKEFLGDTSRLRFLKLPPPGRIRWDLNSGYETWIPDDTKTFLNLICSWIGTRSGSSLAEAVSGAEFVCWRGCLTKIANSPYENRESWRLAISKVAGVIFLAEYDTPEKIESLTRQTERERRMTYWGHRFEDFLSADKDGNLDLESPVNCMETYSLVVRGKLGSHRLLFAGELDARDGQNGDYLELKTQRHVTNDRMEASFHRWKTLKWWLQSFLIGIPRILAGLRDDEGVVTELREWRVSELPRDPRCGWSGSVALNFAASLLSLIKEAMKDVQDPNEVTILDI